MINATSWYTPPPAVSKPLYFLQTHGPMTSGLLLKVITPIRELPRHPFPNNAWESHAVPNCSVGRIMELTSQVNPVMLLRGISNSSSHRLVKDAKLSPRTANGDHRTPNNKNKAKRMSG